MTDSSKKGSEKQRNEKQDNPAEVKDTELEDVAGGSDSGTTGIYSSTGNYSSAPIDGI